ncbi:ester cyclase [Pyxidicoccus trucidator]|uniref:ester cyclase n=1 Tax=Pyxidicoccus trucidator TaxID=2709662 RepID=UPI0013DB7BF5|nr:ester cyclase [Pyxidicoccus trucidator]
MQELQHVQGAEALRRGHELLVRRHVEAENQHLMRETLETVHETCIFEDVALGRTYHGRAGAEAYYAEWWSAFDVVVKGERKYWTEDGTLIAEARYVGRHVGDFQGLAATGRPVELRLAVFITFRDGLMAGERFYYDLRSLLEQLGASGLAGTAVAASGSVPR